MKIENAFKPNPTKIELTLLAFALGALIAVIANIGLVIKMIATGLVWAIVVYVVYSIYQLVKKQ